MRHAVLRITIAATLCGSPGGQSVPRQRITCASMPGGFDLNTH